MTALVERFARDLEGLNDLPSLPPAVARLLATLEGEDVSLPQVAEVIRTDPALAAQMLRVANSAAYGARVPATTIREALLRLGLREVRRLAVLLSLYNAAARPVAMIDHGTFWRHSLGVAHAAEIVARRAAVPIAGPRGQGDAESLFLAGLFHDLGLLVLASHYPEEYEAVRRFQEVSGQPFCAAEVELLQTDHGELGAHLAAHWRLPEIAVIAIRAHHRLELAPPPYRGLVRVLQVAESVCHDAGIGDLDEAGIVTLEGAGVDDLGISAEAMAEIIDQTLVETHRSASVLSAARSVAPSPRPSPSRGRASRE